MSYLAVCLLCVLGIEIFLLLPFRKYIAALAEVSRKSTRVVTSAKISDHWKEKALQRYSRDMAFASLAIGALLLVLGVSATLAALILDRVLQPQTDTLTFFMTGPGLLLATLFSCLYAFLRKRLVAS